MLMFFGPLVCGLGIGLWWMFASRAPWAERLIGVAAIIVAAIVTNILADKSVQGFGFILYGVPWGLSVFVVAVTLLSRASARTRTLVTVLSVVAVFVYLDLLRNDGIRGDMVATLNWRWTPSVEEQFLAARKSAGGQSSGTKPLTAAEADWDPNQAGEWPEFRGPQRDSHAPGMTLATDWRSRPPREVWRRKIGPGWSSFCVVGNRLFTQEQRGAVECVVCYDASTGREIWFHENTDRFWEPVGGTGPRATPTFRDGKLYTLGANGVVNCLNPITGASLWTRDLRKDSGAQPPQWGFSSSPLVVGNRVIVHAGGTGLKADKDTSEVEKGIVAYDAATGEVRWCSSAGDHSYSSPQLHDDGLQPVVLMLTNSGLTAIEPDSGAKRWEHAWKFEGYRVVQPLAIGASSFLLGTGMGAGTRRIDVAPSQNNYAVTEQWTSRDMKPYFNDFVEHDGYLYGFDHDIFGCIDLATGKRTWKKGRYGGGQVLLLPDGDQLLVLSELGELVLLKANPKQHEELSRLKVLDGKSWNHPVLVNYRLYVRNGEEAACFEMPPASAAASSTDAAPQS